jgi:hypothetical protein
MTVSEEMLSVMLTNNKVGLEEKIRDLEPRLKTVVHKENESQTKALSKTFSDFIHAEVGTAVSESLEKIDKESKESVVAGLETRIGEIKTSLAGDFKAMETGVQDRIAQSIDTAWKSNNPGLLQSIIDHLHHPEGAVRQARTVLTLKADGLDLKVTQNSTAITAVTSRVESLEERHGKAVDAFSQTTQGLQADVKGLQGLQADVTKLQSDMATLKSIEDCLNRIFDRIVVLERAVQGKSESAVEVSRWTDSF